MEAFSIPFGFELRSRAQSNISQSTLSPRPEPAKGVKIGFTFTRLKRPFSVRPTPDLTPEKSSGFHKNAALAKDFLVI